MSFSFSASGTPGEVIAKVGQEAANQTNCPQSFADAINQQLSALPADAAVELNANGHTGFPDSQLSGDISLGVTINVTRATPDQASE